MRTFVHHNRTRIFYQLIFALPVATDQYFAPALIPTRINFARSNQMYIFTD
ncbi:Uncharacterised protein [Yersinia enterocolitica]|nr:Uncharacterised protein [Yersinia enterocolitica]